MSCSRAVRQHGSAILPRSSSTAASLSTPHLWISDAQLADAFARFARVSHTYRRHQSHVPGPLEARRRAAKRRMGSLQLGSYDAALSSDFGALFGAQPAALQLSEVRWIPPNAATPRQHDQHPSPPISWLWDGWRTSKSQDTTAVERHECDKEELDAVKSNEQYEACRQSTAALNVCLLLLEDRRHLGVEELRPVMDFLQSSADEPRAQNLLKVARWLQDRKITTDGLHLLRQVIVDKLQLGTITAHCFGKVMVRLPELVDWRDDPDIQQALLDSYQSIQLVLATSEPWGTKHEQDLAHRKLLYAAMPEHADSRGCLLALKKLLALHKDASIATKGTQTSNVLATILDKIPFGSHVDDAELSAICTALTEVLDASQEPALAPRVLRTFLQSHHPSKPATKCRLTLFMRCLHASSRLSSADRSRAESYSSWASYQILSAVYPLRDLAVVLENLKGRQLATALLVGYGNADGTSLPNNTSLRLDSARMTLFRSLQRLDTTTNTDALVDYLKLLQHDPPRAQRTLDQLFEVFAATDNLLRACYLLCSIGKTPDLAMPVRHFNNTLDALVDTRKHGRALQLFMSYDRHSHSDTAAFAKRWVLTMHDKNVQPSKIFDLCQRAAREHLRGSSPLPRHVKDLIEQLALAFASYTPHWSSRKAFDMVWRCVLFLRKRGEQIGTTTARALVRAGIVRPLKDRLPVPSQRVAYIVAKVRDAEGADIAKAVYQQTQRLRHRYQAQVNAKKFRRLSLGDSLGAPLDGTSALDTGDRSGPQTLRAP